MSKITLNFFGEINRIDNPKSLSDLRKEISRVFFFTKEDAEEILLFYNNKNKKVYIENEEDLKIFLSTKIDKINLDINQKSKIYIENLNKLKKETMTNKAKLEELLKKNDELKKLKDSKFANEKKELKAIEEKIKELTERKKQLNLVISKGMCKIGEEIKKNSKKIKKLKKKFVLKSIPSNNKLKSTNANLKSSMNSWEISDEIEATGPYSDWRNNAITFPTKGLLLPAGYVTIKFKSLPEAVKYDVYVDKVLIKTFQGNDARLNNFEVEIRNNEVKQHNTCVIATLNNDTEVISNMRNFFISKKGIGIWQSQAEQIKEMNLSWYYNWSPNPLSGVEDKVDFVPMIWGNVTENNPAHEWIKSKKYKDHRFLLTFNEPDFPDQANMTPEQAVEAWKYIKPIVDDEKVDVSSPVVAIPTVFYEDENNDYRTVGGWFGKYNRLMNISNYRDEFTAVHFYFDYPGEWILDIFRKIHEKTGKKLWITEWGVGQWSQVQSFDWTGGPDEGNWQRETIEKFVREIIPILDKTDYIERYAWFPFDGSNTEKFGNGAGGLFFNTESDPLYKRLTLVGRAYREVGNPAGWNPNRITQDQVIKAKGEDSEITRENVLFGKKATASTELGNNTANKAIDSDVNSRWESQHGKNDPEWLKIDLGDEYIVDGFKVSWEAAAGKEYKIQVSMNGNDWKDVYSVTDGINGETKQANFSSTSARYVRLFGTSKTMEIYGYSIFDFQVFGVKSNQKLKSKKRKINMVNNFENKENVNQKLEHFGVKCAQCGSNPIKGIRYKCAICNNFDYCEKCQLKFLKKHKHPFLVFCNPKMRPVFYKSFEK